MQSVFLFSTLIEFYIYIHIYFHVYSFFFLVIIFFIIALFPFLSDPFCRSRYTWQGFRNTDKVSKSVRQRRHEKELLEGGYHILTHKGREEEEEEEKRTGGTLN